MLGRLHVIKPLFSKVETEFGTAQDSARDLAEHFGVWLKAQAWEKELALRFSHGSGALSAFLVKPWPTCPYRTPLQKRSSTCLVQDQSVQLEELLSLKRIRSLQHKVWLLLLRKRPSQQRRQVRLQVLLCLLCRVLRQLLRAARLQGLQFLVQKPCLVS